MKGRKMCRMMKLSELTRWKMVDYGYKTVTELAAALGLSIGHVARIMNGEKEALSIETKRALCRTLDIHPDVLEISLRRERGEMMEPIKTSSNVEFDVVYADGERVHVPDGILIEADGQRMNVHVGTNRASVLFAAVEAVVEVIHDIGLGDAFEAYIQRTVKGDAPEPAEEGSGPE